MSRQVPTEEVQRITDLFTRHPNLTSYQMAQVLGMTQSAVMRRLRKAGVHLPYKSKGRAPKRKPGQNDSAAFWERTLHDCGLGMGRGVAIGSHHILYSGNASFLDYLQSGERSDLESY